LETLTGLSRALTASLDPETIMPAVVDAALTLFPGWECELWTVEGERVRFMAGSIDARADTEGPAELPLGQGLVGEAAAAGDPPGWWRISRRGRGAASIRAFAPRSSRRA